MKNHCQECGEAIKGRSDKKFCSDDCRNTYNNRLNSDQHNYMRKVNNILRRNRRILASLNPDGKTKATRSQMLKEGFNFNYFTSIYTTKYGKTYYFCYEQGYLPIDQQACALVIRKNYLD